MDARLERLTRLLFGYGVDAPDQVAAHLATWDTGRWFPIFFAPEPNSADAMLQAVASFMDIAYLRVDIAELIIEHSLKQLGNQGQTDGLWLTAQHIWDSVGGQEKRSLVLLEGVEMFRQVPRLPIYEALSGLFRDFAHAAGVEGVSAIQVAVAVNDEADLTAGLLRKAKRFQMRLLTHAERLNLSLPSCGIGGAGFPDMVGNPFFADGSDAAPSFAPSDQCPPRTEIYAVGVMGRGGRVCRYRARASHNGGSEPKTICCSSSPFLRRSLYISVAILSVAGLYPHGCDLYFDADDDLYDIRGDSSGLAVAMAVWVATQAETGKQLVAAIGRIDLSGGVGAVGRLADKIITAHNAGIRRIIIPSCQGRVIAALPAEIEPDDLVPVDSVEMAWSAVKESAPVL